MIKIIFLNLFLLVGFGYGLFIMLGSMRNWTSWKNTYKSIDLEEYLGDLGRVIYAVFGLCLSLIMLYLFVRQFGFNAFG